MAGAGYRARPKRSIVVVFRSTPAAHSYWATEIARIDYPSALQDLYEIPMGQPASSASRGLHELAPVLIAGDRPSRLARADARVSATMGEQREHRVLEPSVDRTNASSPTGAGAVAYLAPLPLPASALGDASPAAHAVLLDTLLRRSPRRLFAIHDSKKASSNPPRHGDTGR